MELEAAMIPKFQTSEWYLTVICRSCKIRIPAYYDDNQTRQVVGAYTLECAGCGFQSDYAPGDVLHYRVPLAESKFAKAASSAR